MVKETSNSPSTMPFLIVEEFDFTSVSTQPLCQYSVLRDKNAQGSLQYVDGSDWLSRWKEDEDGHTIYYLNAGAYQINPSDSEDYWYLDNELSSGFGMSRFGGEEFFSVPGFYATMITTQHHTLCMHKIEAILISILQ